MSMTHTVWHGFLDGTMRLAPNLSRREFEVLAPGIERMVPRVARPFAEQLAIPARSVRRDQRLSLRCVPRAGCRLQRRFFSCRISARSMLRGWAVMANRF